MQTITRNTSLFIPVEISLLHKEVLSIKLFGNIARGGGGVVVRKMGCDVTDKNANKFHVTFAHARGTWIVTCSPDSKLISTILLKRVSTTESRMKNEQRYHIFWWRHPWFRKHRYVLCVAAHPLSIKSADWPKLHDMFKARDVNTRQRQVPVTVCALNLFC